MTQQQQMLMAQMSQMSMVIHYFLSRTTYFRQMGQKEHGDSRTPNIPLTHP